MSASEPSAAPAAAVGPAWTPAERFLVWLAGSALATGLAAWLSLAIRATGRAPEVLLPLGVGAALGWALGALLRKCGYRAGRLALVAAVGWGLSVVVMQEYFFYREYRRQYAELENGEQDSLAARLAMAKIGPASFPAVLRADVERRGRWLWALDALLLALTPAVIVAFVGRPRGGTRRLNPEAFNLNG